MNVRPAKVDDAARLALVAQATFLETFAGVLDGKDIVEHCARAHSPAAYAVLGAAPDTHLWLAELPPGQAPVGYLVAAPSSLPVPDPAADDLEVKRIYVLARFHGAGVGARLMDTVVAHARATGKRRLLLGVYAQNQRALAFYGKHGFHAIGQRKFPVGDHFYDDLVLARVLDGG